MTLCPNCLKEVRTYTKPCGYEVCSNCKFILNKKEIDEQTKHIKVLEEYSKELFTELDEGRSENCITPRLGTGE